MYLRYGSAWFTQNDPAVTIDAQAVYNSRGIVELIRYTWNARGVIHGANQAAVIAGMASLEAVLKFNDGQDLALYLDDQTTIFQQLPTGAALGGTRVTVPPKYPVGEGAEGSTFRTYEFAVQADYPNVNNNILEWQDSVRTEQGGPKYVFLDTLLGPAQPQIAQQQMPNRASQSGRATGMFTWPEAAPPVFPGAVLFPLVVTRHSPRRVGNSFRDYVTEWQYEFESTSPLNGLPVTI